MIALTPWVVALVTISIWPATLFSGVGPRNCERARVLQLLCRFLRALVGLVEGQDAEELRQQHHVRRCLAGRSRLMAAGACAAAPGRRQRWPHSRAHATVDQTSCASPPPWQNANGRFRSRVSLILLSLLLHCVDRPAHTSLSCAMFGTSTERISKSADDARLGVAGDVGEAHAVAQVEDDQDRQPDADQRCPSRRRC